MNETVIRTTDLRKSYASGEVVTEVLKGINIEISQGEFCSISGQSGSGKSTLLHLLGTLDEPTSGDIEIMSEKIAGLSDKKRADMRRRTIGFIFQSFYLIPGLSVYDNIMMPNLLDKRKVDHNTLNSLLETVGLAHRRNHRPTQLSGGEQQRVAIARALANNPSILLADEPTGNLDSSNSNQVMELLHKINNENNVTIVMVTHSREYTRECGRNIFMKDGTISCAAFPS